MSWLPRIVMIAALFALPTVALTQEEPVADEKQPAPGEPSGSTDASAASDAIEKFEREAAADVSPIQGTEPGADDVDENAPQPPTAADKAAADLTAQLAQFRSEIEKRLLALETRLDEQIVRIDALAATTVTANKPVDPNAKGKEMDEKSAARDAEVTQLKADLKKLRSDVAKQLKDLSLAAQATDGSSPQAADQAPRSDGYRLRIHNTTGVEQPLSINGVQWTVRADEWSSVPIVRGPVTVNRPGQGPLEIAAEQIDWQTDKRGNYFDYDLDGHRLADPTAQ